jgi:hypothetical protein
MQNEENAPEFYVLCLAFFVQASFFGSLLVLEYKNSDA